MDEEQFPRAKQYRCDHGDRYLVPEQDQGLERRLAYRVSDVCRMLGLPKSTAYDRIRRREIRSVKIGRGPRATVLVLEEEIRRLLRK